MRYLVDVVIAVVGVSWFAAAVGAAIKKWRRGEKEEASGIIFFFVLFPLGIAAWAWLH